MKNRHRFNSGKTPTDERRASLSVRKQLWREQGVVVLFTEDLPPHEALAVEDICTRLYGARNGFKEIFKV